MPQTLRVPLRLIPQPEGGFTVTSPAMPELITEADTVEEVLHNVLDALRAVVELYSDLNRALPEALSADASAPLEFEALVAVS